MESAFPLRLVQEALHTLFSQTPDKASHEAADVFLSTFQKSISLTINNFPYVNEVRLDM
jgi:hypothetical protein